MSLVQDGGHGCNRVRQWHRRTRLVRMLAAVGLLLPVVGPAMSPAVADPYREFSDAVAVSGEPVGTTWHRSASAGQHGIGVQGDSVFIAWYGEGPEGRGIYVTRSMDGGQTFESPVVVTDTAGIWAYRPGLVLGSSRHVYLVWEDCRNADPPASDVYFSKSSDGGETFGPNVRVDDAGLDPTDQTDPAVAVDDSGRIYVVWMDERGNGFSGVFFSRSVDGGATFEPHTELPNYEDGWPQRGASIAAFGDGRVCISYVDERHVQPSPPMYVTTRYSGDAGATFGPGVPVDICYEPTEHTSLAYAGGGEVYLAWVESSDDCMVSRSADGGQTYLPGVLVNEEPAGVDAVSTVTSDSSGYVAVAWNHAANTLAYAESRDHGQTFLPTISLPGPADREHVTAAIDVEHTVYLAWTDDQDGDLGDIYFSKGTAEGAGLPGDRPNGPTASPLFTIYPNPFRSGVLIQSSSEISGSPIYIYDLRGRLVRRLSLDGGCARWDGRSDSGTVVAPGAYVLKASRSDGGAAKIILTR